MAVMIYVRFPFSLRNVEVQEVGRWKIDRYENSHLPFWRRRISQAAPLPRVLAASVSMTPR